MNIKRILDYIFTTVLCTWAVLQFVSYQPKISQPKEEDIGQKFESIWKDLKSKNLVRGSILIQKGDRTLFSDGALEKQYALASLSKSFVGWRYFQLQQKGLNLESPVCQWLHNFCGDKLKDISLQMLLDHKSGLKRDNPSISYFLHQVFDSNWNIRQIDDLPLSADSLQAVPGEKFIYSNFGYLVLSRLLEIIEQKNFDSIIAGVAKEAHLKDTAVFAKHEVLPKALLVPFTDIQLNLDFENSLYAAAGAGGIKSSAKDLSIWIDYLEKHNFKKMFSSKDIFYRQGWIKLNGSSYEAIWHNGAYIGTYSLAVFFPKSNLRIVILTDNLKLIKLWEQQLIQFEDHLF